MSQSIMEEIAGQYGTSQEDLLDLLQPLSEEQLRWTPNPTTPSIAFHVWHLARWADYLQETINGRGSQIWEKDGLAARWAMDTGDLGYGATGMSMDDNAMQALRIPAKEALLDYARCAFAEAQAAVRRISDPDFHRVYKDLYGGTWNDGQIGPTICDWIAHDNRHLGMIECLIGVQGMRGTADS